MIHKIYNWEDISEFFSDSILLGNGASISIYKGFTYESLKMHATDSKLFTASIESLFTYFSTNDFELVLRLVWQATEVNKALSITDTQTKDAYEQVRDCLIKTVQSIHPEYSEVEDQFKAIAIFLSSFKTVFSLNYDLTLYWVMMYANDIDNRHRFKDCMINGAFDSDWEKFREPYGRNYDKTSLVFYPHGSLVLARNIAQQEIKLSPRQSTRQSSDLLRFILNEWRSGGYVPLFVSEGTSEQKISAIRNSHYLNIVYREVIPAIGDNLTIFGWGFGIEDIHILKKIKESNIKRIAVSVYNKNQSYCDNATQMIRNYINRDIGIVFFDSESSGCWNQ